MKKNSEKTHFDAVYLISFIILLGIGALMIFSSSQTAGLEQFGDSYFFIKKHIISLILGSFAFIFASKINYQVYKKYAFLAVIITTILVIMTYIPGLGSKSHGAQRWLSLGIRFQPSELSKLALIMFIARYIDRKGKEIRVFTTGLLPIFIITGICSALILKQPDLGTTALIGFVTCIMLYTAGAQSWHMFILILAGARATIWYITQNTYQFERVKAFLNPWADPQGISFHIVQSLIAIGSGGLFGFGLGSSRQKFYYLPQQYTDFIFAIICEELGFIGALAIIIIWIVFIIRGLTISNKTTDFFGKYIALGIVSWLGIQALMNIGVVVSLLPTTGIPLPFISFGGTSLIITMYAAGILVNIDNKRKTA